MVVMRVRGILFLVGLVALLISQPQLVSAASASIARDMVVPTGRTLVDLDTTVQVTYRARLGRGFINTLVWSPDGKLLAMAGSIGIWLQDTSPAGLLSLFEARTGAVTGVAFS